MSSLLACLSACSAPVVDWPAAVALSAGSARSSVEVLPHSCLLPPAFVWFGYGSPAIGELWGLGRNA